MRAWSRRGHEHDDDQVGRHSELDQRGKATARRPAQRPPAHCRSARARRSADRGPARRDRDETEGDQGKHGPLDVAIPEAERRDEHCEQQRQPDRAARRAPAGQCQRARAASRACDAQRRAAARRAARRVRATRRRRGARRCVARSAAAGGEHESLSGDERDRDAAPASVGTPSPRATTTQMTAPLIGAASTRRVSTASSATPAPTPSSRGTSRIRSFATSVSSRRARRRGRRARRAGAHAGREPGRMRQEDRRGESEHEPVARRHRPLQKREVAAGVLEQRPLVDHRQLEVRVGVVDRLPARLRDDHEQERQQREGLRGIAPDMRCRRSRPPCRAGRWSSRATAAAASASTRTRLRRRR